MAIRRRTARIQTVSVAQIDAAGGTFFRWRRRDAMTSPAGVSRTVSPTESRIRQLHLRARSVAALGRLAIISRILLALAFVPTALVKVQGKRFTVLSTDTPIGYFFEAMYQSGGYWRFIGVSQLLAGLLLLIPQTATIGAVLFFPIILNVFIITVALQFTGTPLITGLMLLASLFLLCWDYHRFATVLWGSRAAYDVPTLPALSTIEKAGYAIGGAAAMGILFMSRGLANGLLGKVSLAALLFLGVIGFVLVVSGWVGEARRTVAARARLPSGT